MFDGYRDVTKVGEGGLGKVYRAVRISTNGTVAIKQLPEIEAASPAGLRARRELEAMLRLKGHPNVVSVEEIFDTPAGPCIVMEFLDGGSLLDRVVRGPLEPAEAVLVGQQVASALAAAHEMGMVHRDIKPHNLLVSSFGQVKVCDFGIAGLTREAGGHTYTQAFTLAYASPEELDGEGVLSPASDVYSFGATMAHLLSGRKPSFRERAGAGLLDGLTFADPVAQSLVPCLVACMQFSPTERPSIAGVCAVFERASAELGRRRVTALAPLASAPLGAWPLVAAAAGPTVLSPAGGAGGAGAPRLVVAPSPPPPPPPPPPSPFPPAGAGRVLPANEAPTTIVRAVPAEAAPVPVHVLVQPQRSAKWPVAVAVTLTLAIVGAGAALVLAMRKPSKASTASVPASVATTVELAGVATTDDAPVTTAAPTTAPATTTQVTQPPTTLPPPTAPPATVPATAPPAIYTQPLGFDEATTLFAAYMTAVSERDYATAWAMLTPRYQRKYLGWENFQRFWETVDGAGIRSVESLGQAGTLHTLGYHLWFGRRDDGTTSYESVEVDLIRDTTTGAVLIDDYRYLGAD